MAKSKQTNNLVPFTRDMRTAEKRILAAEKEDRFAGGHKYKAAAENAVSLKLTTEQIWTLCTALTVDRGMAASNRSNLVAAMTFGPMFNDIDKAARKLVEDGVFGSLTLAMENIFRRIKAGEKKGQKAIRSEDQMVSAVKKWKRTRVPAKKSVTAQDGEALTKISEALALVGKVKHKATRERLLEILTDKVVKEVEEIITDWENS